jgi:hypothetical protein
MSRSYPVSRTRLESAEPRLSASVGRKAGRAGNTGDRRAQRVTACALALATGWAATSTMPSRGDVLRADLQAAGAAIRDLGLSQPLDHVQKTVAALFPGNTIDVDASQFPGRVVVTLRALDRNTCQTASTAARRMQGKVVIELRGFASPGDCGERNDMAWLILP